MDDKAAANAAHRAEVCKQLSPIGQKLFKYIEFDKDEELLAEIRKHPIGLVAIGAVGIFISLAVFVATAFLSANVGSGLSDAGFSDDGSLKTIIILIGLVVSLLALGVTAISLVLYIRNVIFVTSDKVAQVNYISLFNRKVTQLGIGQIEDVTASQQGILSHIFGYGTLIIETAGERPNPEFTLVPNPYPKAQLIVEAHENYVEKYGN